MNKAATFLTNSKPVQANYGELFSPENARDKIDLAILALMLPADPDKAVKDAFMHCHLAFDGVPRQTLEAYFQGHSAVAFEILQGLMSPVDSISASIYDRADSLSASQRQHFCNALLVVFGALNAYS
ncbi:MAG: hypothetical protein P8O91_06385 [Luminiphilus sp.]|nr:hypothetical protein [Luminiphilus sp.]